MSPARQTRTLIAAARPEEAAAGLAARHGPPDDRPSLRKDLRIRRQVQMGDVAYIVKNPATMKYYMFRDAEWALLRLFDGTRTREEILAAYNAKVREPASITLVLNYEDSLRRMELIEMSAAEHNLQLLEQSRDFRRRKAEEKAEGFNIFFIMFKVLDPERFLQKTVRYVRWIWTPPVVAVTCVASAWTVGVFVLHGSAIWAGTLELYHFVGKPLIDVLQFFVILCVIGFIHEFGHAYAVKIFGGECHDIGMALFYFTPVFYTDTSDSFMFTNKFHKFAVTVAGIYIEAIICSTATALWVFSYPDTLLHELAYKTMLLTGFATVFFNINPLIKVDGYNALASLLELPGMREGSFRLVASTIQKHVLRLPVEIPPMSARKRRIYWVYGVLSIAYTASIMLLIAGWVNNFFQKYFLQFATPLVLLSLYYLFRKRVRALTRVGKMVYLDKKELIMSPKSRGSLLVAAAILAAILFVPWSRRTIPSEAVLKPIEEAVVQAPEGSVVERVLVHEGDQVAEGQVLFVLSSASADEGEARSATKTEFLDRKSSVGRSASNASQVLEAERHAAASRAAWVSAKVRSADLTVKSPIAGRVLTPRTEDLAGRFVVEGAPLARIGDCSRLSAEVGVSERLLEYLRPGAVVTASIRMQPMRFWSGTVTAISPATQEQPATASAARQPAVPSEIPGRFVARAVFDNGAGTLLPGSVARVKIRSSRESYARRAWSVFWRWTRTIFW